MLRERIALKAPALARVLRKARAQTPAQVSRSEETTRLLLGRYLSMNQPDSPRTLHEVEFKVFSQFGDDGIIQYLVRRLGEVPATFVEFGVEDYTESNTRFLLRNDNWSGLVLDGSELNVRDIKSLPEFWQHDLTAVDAFITRDNINTLIGSHGFTGEIGLLSIDIDGNDYWVWEAIDVVDPVIVVVEYNADFGPDVCVSVPYAPDFRRTVAHHSNIFFGASLAALRELGEKKGYTFVGCESHGTNAYFVRTDKLGPLAALAANASFTQARFRQARDKRGELTYEGAAERRRSIEHLEVFDFRAGEVVPLRDATR